MHPVSVKNSAALRTPPQKNPLSVHMFHSDIIDPIRKLVSVAEPRCRTGRLEVRSPIRIPTQHVTPTHTPTHTHTNTKGERATKKMGGPERNPENTRWKGGETAENEVCREKGNGKFFHR